MIMPIPLADIGDVIGLIVTVLIIGFSVISKLISAQAPRPLPPDKRPPGGGPPRAGGQPRAGQPAMSPIQRQIDEFLREVRGEAPRAPAGRPVTSKKIVEAVPLAEPDTRPARIEPAGGFGKKLTQHVADHIEQDSISTRDAHLGEYLKLSDERVEGRLHDVFDHDVGQLINDEPVGSEVSEGTDAMDWDAVVVASSIADEIRELLGSPENIRKVFVAAEILKRPEF